MGVTISVVSKMSAERCLKKSGLTVYGLATRADVDRTYLRRLITGEKRNPDRDVVASLAETLREYSHAISRRQAVRLLRSAGYAPLTERGEVR